MPLLHVVAVATQTSCGRLPRRQCRETNDLGDVAAALHVLRSRAVAGFATVSSLKRGLKVGSQFEVFLVDLLVAGLADVSTDVLRRPFLICRSFLVGPAGKHPDT